MFFTSINRCIELLQIQSKNLFVIVKTSISKITQLTILLFHLFLWIIIICVGIQLTNPKIFWY